MESLNERKRAEGEAELLSTRVGELLDRIALKVRRAAARIAQPDWTDVVSPDAGNRCNWRSIQCPAP